MRRTTFYLDDEIVELARLEGINLSRTVNMLLKEYLQTENIEALKEKQKQLEAQLRIVKNKIKKILEESMSNDRVKILRENTFNDLYKKYKQRVETIGVEDTFHLNWLKSKKNLEKCRLLGVKPDDLLCMLKDKYKKEG